MIYSGFKTGLFSLSAVRVQTPYEYGTALWLLYLIQVVKVLVLVCWFYFIWSWVNDSSFISLRSCL